MMIVSGRFGQVRRIDGAIHAGSPSPLNGILWTIILFLAIVVGPTSSWAGYITTNEIGMDNIFSGGAFLQTPIDIHFNPSVTINSQTLGAIDTQAEWAALLALAPAASPTVDLFFLDAVNWCGTAGAFDGCGQVPPNAHSYAVNSLVAAGVNGAELLSHELGHNLGLFDLTCGVPNTNLMCGSGYGDTTLTPTQVDTILLSPLVQLDKTNQRFISITPIAVVSVPEPGTLWLLGVALFSLCLSRRRVLRVSPTKPT